MMKNYSLQTYMLIGGLLLFIIVESCHPNSTKKESKDTSLNGAYAALNHFALARTYPFEKLPKRAHYDAWASTQIQTRQTSAGLDDKAPWESIGPLNIGGRTLTLAFNPQNPQTMFAGSASGGLWRSYTAGLGPKAWEYVSTGFPVLGVGAIAFAPRDSSVMYIGTGEVYNHQASGTGAAYRNTRGSYGIGILKSVNGGKSWRKSLDWSFDQNKGVWDIKVSQQNPSVVYAATTDGVYKSVNAGESWEQVHEVVMATSILIHPEDDQVLLVGCGNFQSPGYGIYRSQNGGKNWVKIRSSLPLNFRGKVQLEFAPSKPDVVYASIGNGFGFEDGATWLCKSEDFGRSWGVQSNMDYSKWQGWFAHDVAVSPQNPDELAIVGITVWKSLDAGFTLDSAARGGLTYGNIPLEGPDGPPDYVHSDCHDVIYHPTDPNIFYVANDGGIHYTKDNGKTYRSVNGGYASIQFYNGTSNSFQDSTFYLGGLQDNGSIHWNGDQTWTRIAGGDGSWSAIDPTNDRTIYVSSQYLRIRKSVNRGNDFDTIHPQLTEWPAFIAPFLVAQSNPVVMYAGGARVYKSGDRGNNWSSISHFDTDVFQDLNPIFSMALSPNNTQVLYIATAPTTINGGTRGKVYVTTDGGGEWFNITGNLPDRYPMDMAIDPTNDGVAYITFSGYGTGHVFKTNDYGRNWQDISQNLPDVPTNAVVVDPKFPNNLYIGNDIGVFASVDGGIHWEPYQNGLYDATLIFDLTISPVNRKLRAASHGNGAFQRDLLEVPPIVFDEELSFEVFPNPINDFATIDIQTSEDRHIKVELVDLRGRLVKTFFDSARQKGRHRESLNMRSIAAATYVLVVSSGDLAMSKKVVVSR